MTRGGIGLTRVARAVAARRRALARGTGVDVAAALNLVGSIFVYLGIVFLFPAAIAIGYGEAVWPFVVSGLVTSGVGLGLARVTRGGGTVGLREGYLVVALVWLLIAVIGTLPYLFAEPQLSHPVDAFFESMSGFSTTSSSVLTDVEGVSRSIAMWRQYTVWLGGLGIIVVFLAVLPTLRVGGRQALVQHEMPGPELGLGETVRQSGRRFVALYLGLTALEIVVLTTFGLTHVDDRMSLFNAVAHTFTTMGTGGFSTEARSVEPFAPASQWVIAFFMVVAGSNFALLFAAIVRRRVRSLTGDEEFRVYLGVLVAASAVVLVALLHQGTFAGEAAVRHAVFNTASMLTTTGFASADFNQWIPLSALVLFGVVMLGPSAGSTGGSIKIVRHIVIAKMLRRDLAETLHPEVVRPLRLNGVGIAEGTLQAIIVFVFLYLGVWAASALLILVDSSLEGVHLTAFQSVADAATTLGNAGPGLGFAGPMGSFAPFSDVSTFVMAMLMYLGRLELMTVLVLFTPQYWRI